MGFCGVLVVAGYGEEVGGGWVHDHVQLILRLHDEATKANAALTLA